MHIFCLKWAFPYATEDEMNLWPEKEQKAQGNARESTLKFWKWSEGPSREEYPHFITRNTEVKSGLSCSSFPLKSHIIIIINISKIILITCLIYALRKLGTQWVLRAAERVPGTVVRVLESLEAEAAVGSKRIRPEWRDYGIYSRF